MRDRRARRRVARFSTLLLPLALIGCGDESEQALCTAEAAPISAIQGPGSKSPQAGDQVLTAGVVTARFSGDDAVASGLFIQSEPGAEDDDPRTSEGLFLVTAPEPPVGHRIAARGVVAEIGEGNRTQTALVVDELVRCGAAPESPAPRSLRLPGPLEAHEGMLLRLGESLVVTDVYALGVAGQMRVASGSMVFQPTEIAAPGDAARDLAGNNLRRSLLIDDGSAARYPTTIAYLREEISLKTLPRVGDRLTGLVGVLDDRGGYRLQAIARMEPLSRRQQQRYTPPAGEVSVAGFNLHNFFNGDGQGGGFPTVRGAESAEEFTRQRDKLVAAILGLGLPDILAVSELENDGYGRDSAVASLVMALNQRIRASPGGTYRWIAPASPRLGSDAIAVGLIYRQDKVRPLGAAATLLAPPFDEYGRPPLAQTFEVLRSGNRLTVVSLHLKSKGCGRAEGPDRAQGDGQGCFNATRLRSVEVLLDWLADDPTGAADPDVLLIGDLNAYSREDPIRLLERRGWVNLMERFHDQPQYTYIYRGQAGSLDHAFAGPSLAARARGARIWHINADYAAWLNYRLEGKPPVPRAGGLYKPDAVRSSDHDPLVVSF